MEWKINRVESYVPKIIAWRSNRSYNPPPHPYKPAIISVFCFFSFFVFSKNS